MGAHTIVLELLQIPYEKVKSRMSPQRHPIAAICCVDTICCALQKKDTRMHELMKLAHEFLQCFCLGNKTNQGLLHKHLDLFLTPSVSVE